MGERERRGLSGRERERRGLSGRERERRGLSGRARERHKSTLSHSQPPAGSRSRARARVSELSAPKSLPRSALNGFPNPTVNNLGRHLEDGDADLVRGDGCPTEALQAEVVDEPACLELRHGGIHKLPAHAHVCEGRQKSDRLN